MAKDRSLTSQIYLLAEARLGPQTLMLTLDAGTVACVLLRAASLDDGALEASIQALRPVAQEREVAFLIEDRPRLARETGCDGVHLTEDRPSIERARQELGDEAIVGVSCGVSRHRAMVAAEAGADYVAFGGGASEGGWDLAADPELLTWWQALITTPCVAAAGGELRTAADMAAAGADFVAVGSSLWTHRQGPDTAIRELQVLIGTAGNAPNASPAKDD